MRMLFAERGMGEPISLGAALLAGKKVAPDITELLTEDHRTVIGWFDWFETNEEPAMRAAIMKNIFTALWAHMAAEEEYFYPEAAAMLGDASLVERVRGEHEAAKKIIRELQAKLDGLDGSVTERMAELRRELEMHIHEEETELFPKVRDSNMDLYATGRMAAARRVERLLDLTGRTPTDIPLKETAAMPVSKDKALHFFKIGLRNIHAAVREGKTMVEAQLNRLENYPELKMKLEQHNKEKDMQLERIETILDGLGESRSAFKDTAMSMMGSISSASTAMAGDEIIKSSFTTYGLANFEAASYETLILFGEAAEQYGALPMLQQSLSEERGMACFIAENLRGTGMRFLALETEGRQASH